jgi:hypothetical protein
MKIPLTTMNALKETVIDSPCPVSWDTMHGDEKVRFCGQCQKHVHDVTEMTAAAAAQLISDAREQICVQLYRRQDGTLLTADGLTGVREGIWRWLRRRMAWAAALFALIFLPGCPGGGNMRRCDTPIVLSPEAPAGSVQKAEEKRDAAPMPTPPPNPNSR